MFVNSTEYILTGSTFQALINSISWLGLAPKTPHLQTFPTSRHPGSAGALAMAARAPSAPLDAPSAPLDAGRSSPPGRSKLLGLAARRQCTCQHFWLRWSARNAWSRLLAPLRRSKWLHDPLGSNGALNMFTWVRRCGEGRWREGLLIACVLKDVSP